MVLVRRNARSSVRLVEGGALAGEELDILRWGRDYGHESRAGHKSKSHREASALEALVAYWYLHDPDRLHEVFETPRNDRVRRTASRVALGFGGRCRCRGDERLVKRRSDGRNRRPRSIP